MLRYQRYLLYLVLTVIGFNCRTPKPAPPRMAPNRMGQVKPTTTAPKPTVPRATTAVAAVPMPPQSTTPSSVSVAKLVPKPIAEPLLQEPALPGTMPVKREFRAVWIATVENIDWPSKKGLSPADQQREICELFDMTQQTGLNAVVVQIRAAADAFYAKGPEPWSEWLTGQQGLAPNPFYDPLDFMLKEAHSRNLEFHAWFNLDRATFSRYSNPVPTHISYQRPNWMIEYAGRKLFNLGLPEVRAYVASVAANMVRNYDVDGIHFDDYFYPYAEPGHTFADEQTYKLYGNGLSKGDWRRQNVDNLIRQIGDSIRAVRPTIKFGVSPFGIWKNQSNDPLGSATNGGQAYFDLYADTRKWAKEGWIDYIVPQVYFSTEYGRAPYRTLVDWWTQNNGRGHLYIGHGAYRLTHPTKTDGAWTDRSQMPTQVRYNRQQSGVTGSVYFSAQSLKKNLNGFRDSLRTDFYRLPALIPTMAWLDSLPPLPPHDLKAATTPDGVELYWQSAPPAPDGDKARYYIIYRTEGNQLPRTDDLRRMLTICTGEMANRFIDKNVKAGQIYTYAITAVDRLHNESKEVVVQVTPGLPPTYRKGQ